MENINPAGFSPREIKSTPISFLVLSWILKRYLMVCRLINSSNPITFSRSQSILFPKSAMPFLYPCSTPIFHFLPPPPMPHALCPLLISHLLSSSHVPCPSLVSFPISQSIPSPSSHFPKASWLFSFQLQSTLRFPFQ